MSSISPLSLSSTSEALTQLSQLSKTIGLCAQEMDQLRSDNTRLQLLLRTRTEELNASLNENKVLRERCFLLENQLNRFNVNQEARNLFDSQNSWDSESEQYLANVSNEDLLAGTEDNMNKNNSDDRTIDSRSNSTSTYQTIDANKRLKTSDNRTNYYVETEPIASTSSAVNLRLDTVKVDNNESANYSNRNRIIPGKEITVKSNVSQVLTKFIASTPKESNSDTSQILSLEIENKIKITMCLSHTGRRLLFQVNSGDSVLSLRRKLQEREGYPCVGHRLVFGGQLLNDGSRLSDYNIRNGSVIQCILR